MVISRQIYKTAIKLLFLKEIDFFCVDSSRQSPQKSTLRHFSEFQTFI